MLNYGLCQESHGHTALALLAAKSNFKMATKQQKRISQQQLHIIDIIFQKTQTINRDIAIQELSEIAMFKDLDIRWLVFHSSRCPSGALAIDLRSVLQITDFQVSHERNGTHTSHISFIMLKKKHRMLSRCTSICEIHNVHPKPK